MQLIELGMASEESETEQNLVFHDEIGKKIGTDVKHKHTADIR